jgi:hypothetical protein
MICIEEWMEFGKEIDDGVIGNFTDGIPEKRCVMKEDW